MLMADVFSVLFVILGFWVAAPALCLVLRSLVPERLEASRARLQESPGRCLALGFAYWIPGVLAAQVLGKIAKPLGALFAGGLFFFAFLGIAALATRVGEGLESPLDEARPWLATVRGMACLEVVATVPFMGWFLVLPMLFLVGAGAALRGLRAAPAATPAPEAEVVPEGAPA